MSRPSVTDEEILAGLPAAEARMRRALRTEPHAHRVRFIRSRRSLHIDLTNGSAFEIPVDLIGGLRGVSDHDLAKVKVGVAGISLRWERIDADQSVAVLARIALGRRTLMRAAGVAGGSARSAAKTRAARRNGQRGGRPRKAPARA